MTDIQKMIEEEAEKKYLNLDDEDFLDFSDEEKLKAFKAGANFVLEQTRWRKLSEIKQIKEFPFHIITRTGKDHYTIVSIEENRDLERIKFIIKIESGKDPQYPNNVEWKPIE